VPQGHQLSDFSAYLTGDPPVYIEHDLGELNRMVVIECGYIAAEVAKAATAHEVPTATVITVQTIPATSASGPECSGLQPQSSTTSFTANHETPASTSTVASTSSAVPTASSTISVSDSFTVSTAATSPDSSNVSMASSSQNQ